MIGWLYRLIVGRFVGCAHTWETFNEISVFEGGRRPVAREYHQRCTKCGKLQRRSFSS